MNTRLTSDITLKILVNISETKRLIQDASSDLQYYNAYKLEFDINVPFGFSHILG